MADRAATRVARWLIPGLCDGDARSTGRVMGWAFGAMLAGYVAVSLGAVAVLALF